MSPCSFDGIMHAAVLLAAFCARKFAAWFEINMNIELFSFSAKIY
jgi:hypothetical protein